MMGSESCDEDERGQPARRIPRVCLRQKPGAAAAPALHVTLSSHSTVDLKKMGLLLPSPGGGQWGQQAFPLQLQSAAELPSAARQPAPGASFSVTKVLAGRHHHGRVSSAAVSLASPTAAAAAAEQSCGQAVVRDSGLSNVFDAFEREFERFQHEVQHNYMSQGFSDRLQTADSSAVLAPSAATAAAAALVQPSQPAGAEPAWCRRCGKCAPEGHGPASTSASTEHDCRAATTNCTHAACSAASPLPAQHEPAARAADRGDARPACSAAALPGCSTSAVPGHRPAMLHVTAADTPSAADFAPPTDCCTPSLEALSGSVVSLFIDEDDQGGYVKRWLSEMTSMDSSSSTMPSRGRSGSPTTGPVPPHACGLGCSSKGCLAECASPASQNSVRRQQALPPYGSGRSGAVAAEAAAAVAAAQERRQQGMAVFDSGKFRKLKELAENVELELSDFCTFLPEFEPLSPLSARSDSDGSMAAAALRGCKYTSHHECVRLVPATCKGFGSAEGGSGNGGSSGGSSDSAAPALPTPEGQRTPKQLGAAVAAAAHHERDDADSGYGGSGGSLPPQGGGSGSGARGDSSKQLAVANGSGKHRSSTLPALGHEELCKLIRLYNLRCGSSQLLTMPDGEDATFQGCIQVCISLSQPISMVLSPRPASIYEALNREGAASAEASLGSSSAAARPLVQPQRLQPRVTTAQVSLPRNAVMSLHVTSEHTAADVVQRLLAKFKITDNPRKFALYEQTLVDGAEVKLRKVADAERPLVSFLLWNSAAIVQQQREAKRFVLTEDSKGDVNWDAFSIPELLNFLRILEREEKDYADEIRQKYVARRLHLETALREARGVATASPLTKIRR